MATARPTLEKERPQAARKSPIGEVRILVYGLEPGQTEVQVRFPDDAVTGRAGASRKQAKFRELVVSEMNGAFETFGRHPAR